ncbi:MAG: hypothetical protein EX271_10590 [Acidimicrobiales bacterium]|nr:hypothetical protein [Hyphomonadaceae bacterium]RZV39632.1 MAG: hypothetical protein EX271_10590 [Acidimicrobiales bacterium]
MSLKSTVLLPLLSLFAAMMIACAPAEPELAENLPLPGSDRDEHGCIPSAGYVWSEEKQKCVRPWEEEAELNADEPGEEEIREYGRVVSFEDGIYPIFNITLEFPERGMRQSFFFNVMEVGVEESILAGLVDQFITIHYTSEMEPALIDMLLDGVSLVDDAFEVDDAKTMTGVLSGADAPTMSDLPGSFLIKEADGSETRFEYYIPDAMAAANGKTVNITYVSQTRNEIIRIIPSDD